MATNDPKLSDSRPDERPGQNTEEQSNYGNRGRIPAPRLFTRAHWLGRSDTPDDLLMKGRGFMTGTKRPARDDVDLRVGHVDIEVSA